MKKEKVDFEGLGKNLDVAILFPVYGKDDPHFLWQALKSLSTQDYSLGALRIYVGVDGEVPNEIEETLDQFSSWIYKKIKIKKGPCGLSKNVNNIIRCLEGEKYIFRMDADDVSKPNRISKQVKFMEENESVGISGGFAELIDYEGRYVGARLERATDVSDIIREIPLRSPLIHPTVVFRCTVMEEIEYSEDLKRGQDLDLWLRCLQNNIEIKNMPISVLEYRVKDGLPDKGGFKSAFSVFVINAKGLWKLRGVKANYLVLFLRCGYRVLPPKVRFSFYKKANRVFSK